MSSSHFAAICFSWPLCSPPPLISPLRSGSFILSFRLFGSLPLLIVVEERLAAPLGLSFLEGGRRGGGERLTSHTRLVAFFGDSESLVFNLSTVLYCNDTQEMVQQLPVHDYSKLLIFIRRDMVMRSPPPPPPPHTQAHTHTWHT